MGKETLSFSFDFLFAHMACPICACYAKKRARMTTGTLKWLTRCLGGSCALGAVILVTELQAQDFTYTNANGTITITGYTGPGGDVVIPATIDGLLVTSIGDGAFYSLPSLTGITIPDVVTNLGDWAFASCGNLARLAIGKGITTIKGGYEKGTWGTFQFCSSLTRIAIPDNVTRISDGVVHLGGALGAFYGCSSLTNVTIGKGLTYLGAGAFNYCNNLLSVYFQGDAPTAGIDYFGVDIFHPDELVTLYYLPGTTGWGSTYASRPTMLWNPQVQTTDGSLGVRQNQFGFNIAGTPGIPLVIEASTNLAARAWVPLQTCTLTNGLVYFGDAQSTNYPSRFYRIRSP